MYDPISVDTALVSANGDLLISLTDGNIVNAGKVRGAQGTQGERGFIGERGEPGRDGINGAQWHTGVGMPEVGLGEAGDLYMDVASALIPIYQKVGNDWLLLCNLKSSPGGGVSGGNGVGGGGGNIIIHNGPIGPNTDSDGVPVNNGDLWYDPLNGWLHVYHNNEWLVIAGDPPVLMSAMPPDQDYGEHPIQEGSLWFDTEQLALYVAGKDSLGAMRWITALPSDRSAVDDTVNIPFTPPGIASNGTEATNPVTGIVYVYNATKKQWIDKAPKMGGAYYQEDAPDPNIENLRPGDLWIDSNTHNLNVWTGDTWAQVNPGCNSNPKVHFQPAAPDGTQHIRGDLWIDSDTNKLFTWNGDVWMEVGASCGGPGTEEFVKVEGDTMTGALILEDENGDIAEINLSRQAVHKTYVDDQDSKLQQEIINLEEEISNIQASVEGGRWDFTINPSVNAGQYRMSGGTFTQATQTITINRKDLKAADHYWAQSEVGHYLEILDQTIGSTNNALYAITAITKDTGAGETVFTCELVRGTGSPSNDQPCVIKTFELQGGDPTAYVRKVGDVMTGPLRLQDGNGNPSNIYLDDQAVHKQYVDETVFGLDRECIILNDGKLCGGEPMPRFYKIPNWSETQKSAGTAHPDGIQTPYYWAILDRWVYTVKVSYNSSTKAKAHLKIYLSKTNNMHDGFDHWTTFTARYEDHYSTIDFLGVTGNYIWIYEYLGASSANNNTKYAGIQSVKTDKTIRDHVWSSKLSGFSAGWVFVDSENNFCCRVQKATYNSNTGFTYTYSLFFHNDETGYETTVNPQYLSGAPADTNDARPFEQVHRDQGNTSDVKGFYWFAGKMSGYNIRYLSSHEMYYFDPDDNFRSTKCTAAMPYGVNYFKPSYNTNTGTVSYSTTSSINFDNGLGSTHAKIFYSKVIKRFMCIIPYSSNNVFNLDGSMGYKVYRSAEYEYENIVWKSLDWARLFNASNGGELVLEEDNGYAVYLTLIGNEVIVRPKTGPLGTEGIAGEPLLKYPYGSMYGSVDGGKTWEERKNGQRDENGVMIRNYYPYWSTRYQHNWYNDGTMINMAIYADSDTEQLVFNDEGLTDAENNAPTDPLVLAKHQTYELPFSLIDGTQLLYWNGIQIQPPLKEEGGGDQLFPAIAPLNVSAEIYNTTNESSIVDGRMYTFRYDAPTSSSWNQVFLTPKFIKDNSGIPAEATDIVANDMSGTWTNFSSDSRSRVSTKGTKLTMNGLDGVLVNMNPTSTTGSSSYRDFDVSIPNAVSYLAPFEQSGIIPLD